MDKKTIVSLVEEHQEAPHFRKLQKTLADEVTRIVHSEVERLLAVKASEILFGKATSANIGKRFESIRWLS